MRKQFINSLYGGAESEPLGLTYLKANAHLLYDFTTQSQADNETISSAIDLTSNGRNGATTGITGIAAPTMREIAVGSQGYKAAEFIQSDGDAFAVDISDIVTSSFEIWVSARWDGYESQDSGMAICGVTDGSMRVFLTTQNVVELQVDVYDDSGNNARYVRDSQDWDNANDQGQMVFRVKVDYSSDLTVFWQNAEKAMSDTGTPITSVVESDLSGLTNLLAVGNFSLNGTMFSYTKTSPLHIFRFAITPLITEQSDANDVYNYIALDE